MHKMHYTMATCESFKYKCVDLNIWLILYQMLNF